MTAEVVFIVASGLLVYTFLVYPFMLITLSRLMRTSGKGKSEPLPFVSVIIPAFNEEKVIAAKISALLSSDYPDDRIEILIGSDASSDNTDKIVSKYTGLNKPVFLYRSEERVGKASMLNLLVPVSRGEVLVITDANVIPAPDTIRLLAAEFGDSMTGLCDASVRPSNKSDEGVTLPESTYQDFESLLKRSEGIVSGTMTGPYGGLYAVRKSLFPVLPANILVDDLFVGITVLKRGYRSYNIRDAIAYETTPGDIRQNLMRRTRIAAGAFQNLFHFGPFPGKGFMAAYTFFSHKVLRWFSPFFLALVFMTTVILSGHSDLYFCLLALQLILILLSAIDLALYSVGHNLRPLRLITQFIMMNAALTAGFIKALRGIKNGIWEPTKRV